MCHGISIEGVIRLMYAWKKEGRYWGEVGAIGLSGERKRLKVWGLWYRFLLVDCFGCLVNHDGVCIEVCWWSDLCEGGPGCG